ncbi:hypothetical protein [Prosthecobacter sp.]|uniref:hypothetical protein n=1 Tax=Prosthecobacter sp. TaxID=1965333 RepID=UPI001E193735|nr:hypothetical protein [Prosthecobacter sp.]MCB1278419.1 hypothetical protein [Prosthecobacter sp.]
MSRFTCLRRCTGPQFGAGTRRVVFVFFALCANAGSQAKAEEHDWVSKDGKTVHGSFEGLEGGVVIMKVNQQVFRVPLANLSPESAEQARNLAAKAAATPAVPPGNFKNRGTFVMGGKTSTIYSVNVQRNGTTSFVIETVVHLNLSSGSFGSDGFKVKCQSGKVYGFSARPSDRPLKKVDGVTVTEMKLRTEIPATEDLSTAVFSYEEK